MARKKIEVEENSTSEFNPKLLTKEQLEACVEEYLGLHPKYFVYEGVFVINVTSNLWRITADRVNFNGFKPALEK